MKDVPVTQVTKENYIVPKGQEKLYHCIIEVKSFNPKTGQRISVPRIQKFGRKAFETNVRQTLAKQGYDVIILHNPAEAAAKKAEADAKLAEIEAAKKAAEADAARKAEIYKAVAAALAKQKKELDAEKDAAVAEAIRNMNEPKAAEADAAKTSKK